MNFKSKSGGQARIYRGYLEYVNHEDTGLTPCSAGMLCVLRGVDGVEHKRYVEINEADILVQGGSETPRSQDLVALLVVTNADGTEEVFWRYAPSKVGDAHLIRMQRLLAPLLERLGKDEEEE